MENVKPALIVVTGPTASGKTAVSIELCKRIDGEVVSADSMQLYRGMDIGTAKPDLLERAGVPHHLLDVLDPREHATASQYATLAKEAVQSILARGKMPVVCGGTGLYIDALTRPMRFSAPGDERLREELHAIAAKPDGRAQLHAMLREVDSAAAEKLHENDVRRVVRAIESYRLTGKTQKELAEEDALLEGDYHEILFAPLWPRDALYARINQRVDRMIEQGLVEEVRGLLRAGLDPSCTAMQAIGYKEIAFALSGRCTMAEAVDAIKQASRNYAKRQMTWLRRDQRVRFLNAEGKPAEALAEEMIGICRKEGILP
ncbi:MAG: tRNA (adenosine(37)-N6)-dimethylallyltransferase MiaA [Eubacteriales bacterium]|nr:tRNA (adenosine(37)-N6)-dimethylallyltransferase MiaA [Eubacteriales bacterium]